MSEANTALDNPFAGMMLTEFAGLSMDDVQEFRQLTMYRGTYAIQQTAESGIVKREDPETKEEYLAIELKYKIVAAQDLKDDDNKDIDPATVVERDWSELYRIKGDKAQNSLGRFKADMIDRGLNIAGMSVQDAIQAGVGQVHVIQMGMRRDRNDSSIIYRNVIKRMSEAAFSGAA